jgi:metal-dependent amidase/aminoacylase/carboxypeptidase family protein
VSVQDKEVLEAVEKVAPTIEEIGKKLWGLSEVSLLEIKSSAYLKDLFKKSGFTMALLDGYNMYTTGNFFPIAGGFNNAGMEPFTA